MDRGPKTWPGGSAGSAPEGSSGRGSPAPVPPSVLLAIRAAWTLVGVMGLTVVLMAVFYDEVVGSWAEHHDGARQAFAQGGRAGLERAGFAPPAFLPVGVTMVVVVAMMVWVLAVFLRYGYRWGQWGLFALVLVCVYASIALGFVIAPPAVFVVVAAASLLVEGVTVVFLWHADTLAHVRGPWAAVAPESPDGPASPSA